MVVNNPAVVGQIYISKPQINPRQYPLQEKQRILVYGIPVLDYSGKIATEYLPEVISTTPVIKCTAYVNFTIDPDTDECYVDSIDYIKDETARETIIPQENVFYLTVRTYYRITSRDQYREYIPGQSEDKFNFNDRLLLYSDSHLKEVSQQIRLGFEVNTAFPGNKGKELVDGYNEILAGFNSLEKTVEETSEKVDGFDERIKENTEKINSLESTVATYDGKIQTLSDTVSTYDGKIQSLTVKVDKINETTSKLDYTVTSITEKVIPAITVKIDDFDSRIRKNETAIAGLTTTVDDVTKVELPEISTRLKDHHDKIVDIYKLLNGHDVKFNELQIAVDTATEKSEKALKKVKKLDEQFDSRVNDSINTSEDVKGSIENIIKKKIDVDTSYSPATRIIVGKASTEDIVGIPALTKDGVIDDKFLPSREKCIAPAVAFATIHKTVNRKDAGEYTVYTIIIDGLKDPAHTSDPFISVDKNTVYVIVDTYFRTGENPEYIHYDPTIHDPNFDVKNKIYAADENLNIQELSKQIKLGIEKGQAYPGELGNSLYNDVTELKNNLIDVVKQKVTEFLLSPEGKALIEEVIGGHLLTINDVCYALSHPDEFPEVKNIISNKNILPGSITGDKIEFNSIDGNNLKDEAVTDEKIAERANVNFHKMNFEPDSIDAFDNVVLSSIDEDDENP